MSKVAIVILNWNGLHYLQQFLPSVLASSYKDLDIIVADNASTDQSVSFLKENYPSVQLILLPQNYGFAKGYNEALKKVSAEYYVLLNSDVEVTADWIQPMVRLLDDDQQISACQPKLRSFHQKNLFEYAGAAGGWMDKFGYPFAKGRIFESIEEDRGQYDQEESIFWASGAALFIRSAVFHKLNGLDEWFFAHQEEIDLCWRIQLDGGTIFSCPSSVVYHVGGGTLAKGNPRKTFLNFRNNLVMLFKNLPATEKWWKIPVRVLLDVITAWKGLLGGDGKYFMAIARAHLAVVSWLISKKDSRFYPIKRTGQLHGYFEGSIVWQHFVNKKARFGEIIN